MIKVLHVVGARPNFMKVAPITAAVDEHNRENKDASKQIRQRIVHTGQHYDEKMSRLFFDELGIPKPDINLEVGSGSHAGQTAEIMKRFEKVCTDEDPTHVLVVGDVNSTIACALVASKLGIGIIHVEAGLRSFDRAMPEEINRVLTDAISDMLFTTEESGNENLLKEGVAAEKIHFVGNVMIDTLYRHREKARDSDILLRLGMGRDKPDPGHRPAREYGVLTLHRPSNVDDRETFLGILEALAVISERFPIIFPVHPRSLERIKQFGFGDFFQEHAAKGTGVPCPEQGILCIEPLGYLDFLHLMDNARLALTDSGGIQEETTVLGVPCVTLRNNTERPVTVTHGTNVVVGTRKAHIIKAATAQIEKEHASRNPPLWDGKAAVRIVEILSRDASGS